MKNITIATRQITDAALTAILPPAGVASVTVARNQSRGIEPSAMEYYRRFRNPGAFRADVRVELAVDDAAVESVFDAISFAYGAGFFSDAEAWVA